MLTDEEKQAIRLYYQALSEKLPGFRPRAAQRQMLAIIANTFARHQGSTNVVLPAHEGEHIAVVEGPTGVGKSLAYLLAGGVMAKARGKKLIIASATIALQEQLTERDLPFLIENSGLPLTFALAKGRGRYLCPYRLYQLTAVTAQDHLFGFDPSWAVWDKRPDTNELAVLRDMAHAFKQRDWNGDRDTWQASIDDAIWHRVTNDRHGCLKASCPNRAECPFFLARDILETVDIIVANHDLVLADCAMGGGVILPDPAQSFLCIDEAHHLSKKAVNQFAAEHSITQALFWLDKAPDIFAQCEAILRDSLANQHEVNVAVAALKEVFTEWIVILEHEPALTVESDATQTTWLIDKDKLAENYALLIANTALAARTFYTQLAKVAETLGEMRKDKLKASPPVDLVVSELGFLLGRAEQWVAVWDLFKQQPDEHELPLAKWITRRNIGKNDYLFCASPVNAANNLTINVWRRVAGALLTSATLRSLGSFDYLLQQTGLAWLPGVTTVALASPFNFAEQGELYLPDLRASPKDPDAHSREVASWLPRLINAGEPVGTLVLFASKKQMLNVAEQLPDESLRHHILIQGRLSRHVLLERHHQQLRAGKASVLFGLASLAEGLDLPGESCVHVIIAKLPFAMPDDPVGQTLARWIEMRGGDPFTELMVPDVSIKLIQAVGRLIRTEQDYGRVTILDHRLTRRNYGKKLLATLPPFKRL